MVNVGGDLNNDTFGVYFCKHHQRQRVARNTNVTIDMTTHPPMIHVVIIVVVTVTTNVITMYRQRHCHCHQ